MRRTSISTVAAVVAALLLAVQTPLLAKEPDGVRIGHKALSRYLTFQDMERVGTLQYTQLLRQASQQGAVLPASHPQVIRMRKIFADLLPHSYKFNERAKDWKWDVNVFNSPQINAFCMPGGKIAFFTGILQKLSLTDDEAALVMGHEIAHALREHARARAGKQNLLNIGALAVSLMTGSSGAGQLAGQLGGLASLKFSRDDETEADLVGMELAARAGYDPRAGIQLWEKMGAASQGAPPQWLSTHPSGPTRITTIKAHLNEVMPLYEAAKARKPG